MWLFPQAFLEIIFNLQFPLIETLWQSFWRNAPHTELDWSVVMFYCEASILQFAADYMVNIRVQAIIILLEKSVLVRNYL